MQTRSRHFALMIICVVSGAAIAFGVYATLDARGVFPWSAVIKSASGDVWATRSDWDHYHDAFARDLKKNHGSWSTKKVDGAAAKRATSVLTERAVLKVGTTKAQQAASVDGALWRFRDLSTRCCNGSNERFRAYLRKNGTDPVALWEFTVNTQQDIVLSGAVKSDNKEAQRSDDFDVLYRKYVKPAWYAPRIRATRPSSL